MTCFIIGKTRFHTPSSLFTIDQTSTTRPCLPVLSFILEVMCHWTWKVLYLYVFLQKGHLGCCLSHTVEHFLWRSSTQNNIMTSSSSVSYSCGVVYSFCMSPSFKPFETPGIFLLSYSGDSVSSWQIKNLKGPGDRRKVHKIWSESDQYQVSYDFHSPFSFVSSRGTWRQAVINCR